MAGDDFDWIRGSGRTLSHFTGPDTDRLGSSQGTRQWQQVDIIIKASSLSLLSLLSAICLVRTQIKLCEETTC